MSSTSCSVKQIVTFFGNHSTTVQMCALRKRRTGWQELPAIRCSIRPEPRVRGCGSPTPRMN
jgi:hypothetical protein